MQFNIAKCFINLLNLYLIDTCAKWMYIHILHISISPRLLFMYLQMEGRQMRPLWPTGIRGCCQRASPRLLRDKRIRRPRLYVTNRNRAVTRMHREWGCYEENRGTPSPRRWRCSWTHSRGSCGRQATRWEE